MSKFSGKPGRLQAGGTRFQELLLRVVSSSKKGHFSLWLQKLISSLLLGEHVGVTSTTYSDQKEAANSTHPVSCRAIQTPLSFMERCQRVF